MSCLVLSRLVVAFCGCCSRRDAARGDEPAATTDTAGVARRYDDTADGEGGVVATADGGGRGARAPSRRSVARDVARLQALVHERGREAALFVDRPRKLGMRARGREDLHGVGQRQRRRRAAVRRAGGAAAAVAPLGGTTNARPSLSSSLGSLKRARGGRRGGGWRDVPHPSRARKKKIRKQRPARKQRSEKKE